MRQGSDLGPPRNRYHVRAAARVLDILDMLQESSAGVSLADIAAAVDMPKSTAFRYLTTLESRGYVEQDSNSGTYRFGLAFLPSHTRHLQILGARAKPYLEKLRDRFHETINLAVLDGTRIAYLEIIETQRSMRFAARPGDREPIHSSALGKAIAAGMDEPDVIEIIKSEGMPKKTANTITEVDEFLAELQTIRERGYSIDDRENEDDGRCVAVRISGARTPAAISLSAPAVRFPMGDVGKVAEGLIETAKSLTQDLGVAG